MKIFSILFSIIIVVIGVTFAVLNTTPVTINLFEKWQFEDVALSRALIIAFAIGAISGILAGLMMIFNLKQTNSKLKKELKRAQTNTKSLKASVIRDRDMD